ncbi:MAG TPA: nitrite/sulfite reductase, partial [Usitatibacter sp.]|nr:nitrite/sulfite reductase [Usitatibacter sp.]
MYRYDDNDKRILAERVAQFRDQTRRYLAGELGEDEFRPLRLQNGLYIQRHAPMYRIAVPYGVLASRQLRKLAQITRRYDRGYGHFTTRHNLQLNWPRIEDVPDILAELASVEMHSIQTSGNDVRNITTDPLAGIAPDEIADPRPYAEIIRQWSSFHPEFAYLPRKFKIALNAAREDRTALRFHDIGLELVRDPAGELGFRVHVGGGMGRTPVLAQVIRDFLPWRHALTYCESILRVYNRYGRRDNIWKARIKILVKSLGVEEFRSRVEEDWATLQDSAQVITDAELERVAAHFAPPAYEPPSDEDRAFAFTAASDRAFARWVGRNVHGHKRPGYAAVTLSLKRAG